MPPKKCNIPNLVDATANRLRLIQVNFADEDAETRRGYLDEEIQRALKKVTSHDRDELLVGLLTRFPESSHGLQPESETSPSPEDKALDPEIVVTRFITCIPTLTDQEKEFFRKRLQNAGLSVDLNSVGTTPNLQTKELAGLLDGREVDGARATELLIMLMDVAKSIDVTIKKVCQEIIRFAPAKNRPSIHFGKLFDTMKQFVTNDDTVNSQELEKRIVDLKVLIGVILKAIFEIHVEYNTNHLSKISPEEISKDVHGNILEGKEVKCWKKYKDLYEAEKIQLFENKMKEYFCDHIVIALRQRANRK